MPTPGNATEPQELLARPILSWLARPPADDPADDVEPLRRHLGNLRERGFAPAQRHKILGLLQPRIDAALKTLFPRLHGARVPVSANTRQLTRALQELLEHASALYLEEAETPEQRLIRGLQRPIDESIWRSLHAASRQIMLANLIAAPHPLGAWQRLHRGFAAARKLNLTRNTPAGAPASIGAIYVRTLLAGCMPSSTFTALEWSLLDQITAGHAHLAPLSGQRPGTGAEYVFWWDPAQDSPPTGLTRREPAGGHDVLYLSTRDLCATLDGLLEQIREGTQVPVGELPETLGLRHAEGLLERLLAAWQQARKRRFPRRRQSFRTDLCAGFDAVWLELRPQSGSPEPSVWQVINESPEGYAAMHVSGRTGKILIGDLVAMRPNGSPTWQICVVRWALSENPEHLELGLQILAPRATAAHLVIADESDGKRLPVLLLPPVPPLRDRAALAMPSGIRLDSSMRLRLIVDEGHLAVREVVIAGPQEHSATTDVYLIDEDLRV